RPAEGEERSWLLTEMKYSPARTDRAETARLAVWLHFAHELDDQLAETARIDVGILLLGLADQVACGLGLAALNVGHDFWIGRNQLLAERDQLALVDLLDPLGPHHVGRAFAGSDHLEEHFAGAAGVDLAVLNRGEQFA